MSIQKPISHTLRPQLIDKLDPLPSCLPKIEFTPRSNGEVDFYGASDVLARSLGLERSLYFHKKIAWTHGWKFHPKNILNISDQAKEADLVMVANQSVQNAALSFGCQHVEKVGLPILYAKSSGAKRKKGSLLYMPQHSSLYTQSHLDSELVQLEHFKEYFGQHFDSVIACVGGNDVLQGYWVSSLEQFGVPWITGAWMFDRNALNRMRLIFESVEYVALPVFSSAVLYAAFFGCKVFLYDAEGASSLESQVFKHPFYKANPQMVAINRARFSKYKTWLQQLCPHVFGGFEHAMVETSWAEKEIGLENKKSPEEMAELFGWKLQKTTHGWHPADASDYLTSQELLKRALDCLKSDDYEAVFDWTNRIKSRHLKIENVDYLRAVAFAKTNRLYPAREAVKEELRFFPGNKNARKLCDQLEQVVYTPGVEAIQIESGDEDFSGFFEQVKPHTRVSIFRAYSLYRLVKTVCLLDLPGQFVECGVAAGGSLMLTGLVAKKYSKRPRKIYGFDTFTGMPDPTEEDTAQGVAADETGWGVGTCAAPESFVQKHCDQLGLNEWVVLKPGLFEDSLPIENAAIGEIAFLHMDGDWYSSTKAILDHLFAQLHPDAFIQIDDFGAWDGCAKAIREYESIYGLKFDLNKIDDTGMWTRNPKYHSNAKMPHLQVSAAPQDAFIAPAQVPQNADLYFQRSSILNAIQAHRPFLEGRFLDVGCGIMPYKDLLMQSPSKIETYIGLDIETEIYQADVDLRWDGQRIPLEDASIDSAMATEVLEHCPDPLVVLREIRRVLKPGGAFFFTVPYIWPLHDAPWDFYRYTPFSLKNLLKEAGFEDLNIRALSGWDASLAQMMGLWMKRAPMSPERRNAMAQKLWPIYQELIESDELPSDPEAGNTMATGWSGLVYAAAEPEAQQSPSSPEIAAIDLPLVIVRSHAYNYSETFIEDHVQCISNQTTVLYGWPFPRFIEGDRSVLDAAVEKQLVQALQSGTAIGKTVQDAYRDGLAQFFKACGARVVLLESGLMGAMVSEACVRAELPHVVHFHGVDAFAYKLLEQWQAHYQCFFRTAAAVVGVSQEMVQQLSTMGAPEERLVHAPYGVSTELEAYAQPLVAQPVFLSVGRFVAKKAPHKTLQAFEAVYQKVPTARLIMVGEGPLLKKCKAWVQQQGIQEAVTFAGVQSRRSVSRLMACVRVFVQHSVVAEDGDHEGLPLAILEAGAHGLPVVATRHAGIPDAVREEADGFLVDEGDVQAMALAMYRLAQDAALAARMGAAYQQRVRSDYSRAVSIARLQKLLQATADAGYRKPTVLQAAPGQQGVSMMAPKPIANLEELKSAIAKENDAGTCLQLAQRASELDDETVAYECYEKAVSLDRSCGPAYLEMGKRLGQAAQYADAYLCLKEAERAGQLDATSQQLLQALAANPDLQTDSVLQYQQRRQVFDGQLASQPRRILIFTNLLPPQEMGGYGRSIWELCEGLLLRGHTVSILTADVPELQQKAYAGYERVERYVQRDLQLFGGWSQGGAQAIDDVEQIKKIARHNVKLVLQKVSTFQPDVCMVGNLDFLGAGMLDPILKHGVPILHRLGNGLPGYSADMTPKSSLYCIAGCSEWVNSELQENGFAAQNFALLPPGSPLHEYYRFVPPNYDQLRICFAGLMMAYKGPQLILEALDYLKKLKIPFTCEFAGDFKDPAFEQQFKLQMRQYQLEDSIRLLGFCDREQLRAMYDRSNVLVMPSIFEEPFGKVQIEAQAAGLAVLRSPVGGYKDMIEDGVNGLLFKSEDAKDLARQLFILRGDSGLWSRIALQGQHDAFRFRTQASVETLEALFEGLIANRMTPDLQRI